MPQFLKQLGQAMPTDTANATLYTKPQNTTVRVDQIWICNNTAGAIAARVFFDDDGSTYGTAQALYYDKSVPANDTVIVDTKIYMYTASGTIGIRSATGSALTFTAFGQEIPT